MGTRIVIWKRNKKTGEETIHDVTEWKSVTDMTPAEKGAFTKAKSFMFDLIATWPGGDYRYFMEVDLFK